MRVSQTNLLTSVVQEPPAVQIYTYFFFLFFLFLNFSVIAHKLYAVLEDVFLQQTSCIQK